MTFLKKMTLALFASLLTAQVAYAHNAGDFILRAGAATVDPNEDSSELKLDGAPLAGTSAGLNSDTQLGITMTYMLADNYGLGLLAATPFEHTAVAKGLGIDIGTTKHLPPTFTFQYFLPTGEKTSAYVGAGINYTTFFSTSESSELKNALGGASGLKFSDSWGVALEAGVDYEIADNLLLSAQVWWIDIDTTGSVDTGAGKVKVDVEVDPWVYMLGMGYKF